MKVLAILSIIALIILSGCVGKAPNLIGDENAVIKEPASSDSADKTTAQVLCQELCIEKLKEGVSLEDGPCLSDGNPAWTVNNWVCDVAHSPRKGIDDLSVNQCQDYRKGLATHFVEVSPNCEVIRTL